jgi:hypothetical protein
MNFKLPGRNLTIVTVSYLMTKVIMTYSLFLYVKCFRRLEAKKICRIMMSTFMNIPDRSAARRRLDNPTIREAANPDATPSQRTRTSPRDPHTAELEATPARKMKTNSNRTDRSHPPPTQPQQPAPGKDTRDQPHGSLIDPGLARKQQMLSIER